LLNVHTAHVVPAAVRICGALRRTGNANGARWAERRTAAENVARSRSRERSGKDRDARTSRL
jgi:hypothetical protein